jgi:hypothetical protein
MEGLCGHCCDRLGAYIFMVMLCQVSIIHLFHKSVHTIYMLPVHSVGKSCNSCGAGFDLGVHFPCELFRSLYYIKEI